MVQCRYCGQGNTDFYGLWAYGVVGAMGFGNSRAHGSLDAFFFYALCFCIIPGRLPTLYLVPLSFSSFLSFTLLPPCALHNVLCPPPVRGTIHFMFRLVKTEYGFIFSPDTKRFQNKE